MRGVPSYRIRLARLVLGGALVFAVAVPSAGQRPAARFTTGGRDLVRLDFAGTPVGEFPSNITMLFGVMDVVDKDGQHMLRASAQSAFLIRLPEPLPQDFTIEVDFVPKASGYPPDLTLEGTREINQGESSAHILWHPARVAVIGGARDNYNAPVPGTVTLATVGQLTKVVLAVEDETLKLYTNGRLMAMLPNRKFVRARVLRVLLGGEGDGDQAVHLAGLRITTTVPPVGPLVAGGHNPAAPLAGASPMPNAPSVTPPPAGGNAVTTGFAVSVTMGNAGPVVTWPPVPNASGYAVSRWKSDDGTCCNNASPRGYVATSPWQDQPLPMSGTYEYRVIAVTPVGQLTAQTQFGFRMPGGAPAPTPLTAVLATPPTATITPAPAPTNPLGPPPAGASRMPTPLANGPPPTNLFVNGTPTTATVTWTAVPGATGYQLNRALAGTTGWTSLTPTPITATTGPVDVLPDRTKTYTYQVTALQPNGTFGSASVDFTAPLPADPTGFAVTTKGPDEVEFTWVPSKDPAQYLLAGPGTGNGIIIDGTSSQSGRTYALKGVPPGTHTWTIATSYLPGGVLTPQSSWPTATNADLSKSGRYLIWIESVKVTSDAMDDIFQADGLRNEFYVTAFVRTTDNSGNVLSESNHKSATHGDITYWPPPARVRAGSAGPNGGVWAHDLITPIWDQPNAASTGWSRFELWSGTLTAGVETVDILPAIWESDNDPTKSNLYPTWVKQIGYYVLDLDTRTATGDISNVMLPAEPDLKTVAPAQWRSLYHLQFQLSYKYDRPIGTAKERNPLDDNAMWYIIAIRFNHTVAEDALSGKYGPPGVIPLRLVDHESGSRSTFTHPDLGMGDYTLNIRVERLP